MTIRKSYDYYNKDPKSGDPQCDRDGHLYPNNPPRYKKVQACKHCSTMMQGRCDDCGRNIFGNNEYSDWEL